MRGPLVITMAPRLASSQTAFPTIRLVKYVKACSTSARMQARAPPARQLRLHEQHCRVGGQMRRVAGVAWREAGLEFERIRALFERGAKIVDRRVC